MAVAESCALATSTTTSAGGWKVANTSSRFASTRTFGMCRLITPRPEPIHSESVDTYLKQKFKDDYEEARAAMEKLAKAYTPKQLESKAYGLYEKFRPEIPEGKKGWGARGELDLDYIRSLAE